MTLKEKIEHDHLYVRCNDVEEAEKVVEIARNEGYESCGEIDAEHLLTNLHTRIDKSKEVYNYNTSLTELTESDAIEITAKEYLSYYEDEEPKCKFKVGDKVKRKTHDELGYYYDTVESVPGMDEYDSMDYVYASEGMVLKEWRWEKQKNWELYAINFYILILLQRLFLFLGIRKESLIFIF